MAAVLGREGQQVLAVEGDAALGHLIAGVAHQHMAQRALARTVGAHEHVHLAVAYGEVHASQNFLAVHLGVQIFYL